MYYVYQLSTPSDEIFYIGKGKGGRMYSHVSRAKGNSINRRKNPHLYNKILKIINEGGHIKYKKLFLSESEQECLEKEIFYIKEIGTVKKINGVKQGPLLNLTVGGEGTGGYKLSEETKRKISLSKKGKPGNKWSEASKKKLSITLTGHEGFWKNKSLSEQTKQKMSDSHKGKNKGPISEKRRLAIIKGIKNKKINKENSSHYGEKLQNITA